MAEVVLMKGQDWTLVAEDFNGWQGVVLYQYEQSILFCTKGCPPDLVRLMCDGKRYRTLLRNMGIERTELK